MVVPLLVLIVLMLGTLLAGGAGLMLALVGVALCAAVVAGVGGPFLLALGAVLVLGLVWSFFGELFAPRPPRSSTYAPAAKSTSPHLRLAEKPFLSLSELARLTPGDQSWVRLHSVVWGWDGDRGGFVNREHVDNKNWIPRTWVVPHTERRVGMDYD